jgi:pumilio homology domain family member 6
MVEKRVAKDEGTEQRKMRKFTDPAYPLIQELKKEWEQLRLKRLDKQTRRKHVARTIATLAQQECNWSDLIFKHDASRIVQSLIKFATPEQRLEILSGLVGKYAQMAKTAYGRFVVLKVLKYAPAQHRLLVVEEICSDVNKLVRHRYASTVVDTAYCVYATSPQRLLMTESFYGMEFGLIKKSLNLIKDPCSLSSIWEKFPEKRERIRKEFGSIVAQMCAKEGTIGSSELLHRVCYEYLNLLTFEQMQSEIVSETGALHGLIKQIPSLVHSKCGAQLSMLVISVCGAKERKSILKAVKPHAIKMLSDQFGWMVAARLLDTVDDTVLVKQCLLNEIVSGMSGLLRDSKWARKLMLYALSGQTTKYFSPDQLALLSTGSDYSSKTSKKPMESRRSEHLKVLVPALETAVNAAGVLYELLQDLQSGHLLIEIMRATKNTFQETFSQLIQRPFIKIIAVKETEKAEESSDDEVEVEPVEEQAEQEVVENEDQKDQKEIEMEVNQAYVESEEKEDEKVHVLCQKHAVRVLRKVMKDIPDFRNEFRQVLEGNKFFNTLTAEASDCDAVAHILVEFKDIK